MPWDFHTQSSLGPEKEKEIKDAQWAAAEWRKLPCRCQGSEVRTGRLVGDHRKASSSFTPSSYKPNRHDVTTTTTTPRLGLKAVHSLWPSEPAPAHLESTISYTALFLIFSRFEYDVTNQRIVDKSKASATVACVWKRRRPGGKTNVFFPHLGPK